MLFILFFMLNSLGLLYLLVCFIFTNLLCMTISMADSTFDIWPIPTKIFRMIVPVAMRTRWKFFPFSSFFVPFMLLKIWFFHIAFVVLDFAFSLCHKAPSELSSSILEDLFCSVYCRAFKALQLIYLKNLYFFQERRFFTKTYPKDTPRFSQQLFDHYVFHQAI